jgi:hypothetical protein
MIEVANIKVTKAAQVRAYVAKNPKAKPKEISKAVGVGLQYVYTVMYNAKNKAKVKKPTLTLPKLTKAMEIHKKVMDKTISKWKTMSISSSNTPMQGVTHNVPVQIEMFEPTPDAVNHPAHYKVGGIETIDFIEAKKLNYNIGNVVKYLTRADYKGNRKQDLEKAIWYLQRELGHNA